MDYLLCFLVLALIFKFALMVGKWLRINGAEYDDMGADKIIRKREKRK